MRVTCIGEGRPMSQIIPQLISQGYDVSYFSRSNKIIEKQFTDPINATAIPQAFHESKYIILCLDDDCIDKYPLSRDAQASLATKTVITVFEALSTLSSVETTMNNLRAENLSIQFDKNATQVNSRPEQANKHAHVIDAICTPLPTSINFNNQDKVIPGPWMQQLHPQFRIAMPTAEQPVN